LILDYVNVGSVFYTPEQGLYFVPNVLNKTHGIAYGTYEDRISTFGWGILEINAGYDTNSGAQGVDRNLLIMRAAGFLEAYLTTEYDFNYAVEVLDCSFLLIKRRIEQHASNMYEFFFVNGIKKNETKEKIVEFMNNQDVWMRQQIKLNTNPLWRHASYILSQYDGLLQGYNQATEHQTKVDEYLFMAIAN
jgi:hypothetical protein